MEQLNKVQLRGFVGNAIAKHFGDWEVVRFSVATNLAYTASDGTSIIDTTWHQCLVWSAPSLPDVETIVKGAAIELTGRIRQGKYVNANGEDVRYYEILVNDFKIIPEEYR